MSGSLLIQCRPETAAVHARPLRQIIRRVLRDLLPAKRFDLAIFIVRSPEMAQLNETHLQHEGPTDVITFDYLEKPNQVSRPLTVLHGEIFVCFDEAVSQARRFRTTWPDELVRYIIHGLLHLRGYDDQRPADRRRMKREEDRLLKEIARCSPLKQVARKSKVSHPP